MEMINWNGGDIFVSPFLYVFLATPVEDGKHENTVLSLYFGWLRFQNNTTKTHTQCCCLSLL